MKKATLVLITIIIEAVFLWFISYIVSWDFIDITFIGGVIIFGIAWLFQFDRNQSRNEFNANRKGWAGQGSGEVKPFEFQMSSISLGLLFYIVISFIVTGIVYLPYFITM